MQKCYDLVLWLLQRIERFPRGHRFTVGDRLAAAALDVLDARQGSVPWPGDGGAGRVWATLCVGGVGVA